MIARLGDSVTFYKIGYQLAYAGGLPLVRQLVDPGKKVFIDLKLHDIGNTVARGVESIAKLGATFLTVHAYPQTMKAAVEGRAGSGLKILAVTVLTSYDDGDMHAAGYRLGVSDMVEARAQQAQVLGVDGIVCSAEEAAALRKVIGHQMCLVTPGIRPAGSATGDQKRIMTPARAIAAGADYLVVGRPIIEAADPRAAADAIHRDQAGAGLEQERKRRWQRATGSRASTFTMMKATRRTRRPIRASSRNSADASRARRQIQGIEEGKPLAQCGDRICGLRDRAGLLQFAGIPGQHQDAAAAFERRTRHHRGLGRPAAVIAGRIHFLRHGRAWP